MTPRRGVKRCSVAKEEGSTSTSMATMGSYRVRSRPKALGTTSASEGLERGIFEFQNSKFGRGARDVESTASGDMDCWSHSDPDPTHSAGVGLRLLETNFHVLGFLDGPGLCSKYQGFLC